MGAPYRLSFTAGGLLYSESLLVAQEFQRLADWKQVRQVVEQENLLQARTQSAGKRVLREVTSRLKLLTSAQLDLLRLGTRADQQCLLWLAACKRYQMLLDFGREIIRHKFLQLDLIVSLPEFDQFLETQSIWHPELEKLTDSTRVKLRQVTFRMLREAELINEQHIIQPIVLSSEIATAIQMDTMTLFSIFPISDADIRTALS